ncbi:nucleotidyl transferase AbiEii/AbiGii toxin family protein [Succinimonas sp.]|uniref:nucleotidyl transferase AbiEii/AbiGii toxin family protein n=1 Tax=Succinimonas sp. TaxID=1936151 RepID=UPI0038700478
MRKFIVLLTCCHLLESDALLSDTLALKGGTAINLTIFDLPRLSVDIDMDYSKDVPREAMLSERERITDHIRKNMTAGGYSLSQKSRMHHALDSFVFEYVNAGGMRDNLKIEINYMLRCHVFPVTRRVVSLPWNEKKITVLSVDPMEIFSAKTVALVNRSAARDLYDMFNLQKHGLFDKLQETVFKKCIMFYFAIASESVPEHFDFSRIGNISAQKVKTDLTPVLRRTEHFDFLTAKTKVEEYLRRVLLPEDNLSFWSAFAKGDYKPELLFDDSEILSKIAERGSHCRGEGPCRCQRNRRRFGGQSCLNPHISLAQSRFCLQDGFFCLKSLKKRHP